VTGTHEFRAMGCTVVVGGASRTELAAIERLFAERERIFSRFLPESELNRVNGAAGSWTRVSDDFVDLLELALAARAQTLGLVDPTFGRELEAAGYDRDFSQLEESTTTAAATVARPQATLRTDGSSVLVPAGIRLDLNGVVKGRTVDDALALVRSPGFVSAGGDLATQSGVVVALPCGGTVRLVRGGLATSGTDRRHWIRGGLAGHHLIDPRTGRPAESPWQLVTVCGASCVGADVAAKAAFLLGHAGPVWLDAVGMPGRFVTADGAVLANRSWRRSAAAPCT
jgi:thiamine biosynthesis lipoprotein